MGGGGSKTAKDKPITAAQSQPQPSAKEPKKNPSNQAQDLNGDVADRKASNRASNLN